METLNAVFNWLLRSSWQASVLIGLVLLAHWLFGKKLSPGWRYALWLLVLARLAMPVSPQSPFSIFNLARSRPADSPVVTPQRFNEATPTKPPLPTGERQTQTRDPDSAAQAVDGNEPVRRSTNAARPTLHAPRSTLRTLLTSLPFLWLAGVCFLSFRMAWQNTRFARRVLKQRQVTNSEALDALEDCKQWMRLRTPLTVIETAEVKSPALYGFIRPRLVLPQGMLASFTPQELRYVFLHELAHVKRCDMAVNWIVSALRVLHWFNPVVWFAFRRMAADREVAADSLALSRTADHDHESYGQTIIKLLESFTRPTALPGLVGILEDKQQMKRRISMIARFEKTSEWRILGPVLATVITLASLTDAQTTDNSDSAKNKSPSSGSSITLRRLPNFSAGLWDISTDGRYGLGDVRIAESGTETVPFVVDLVTGVERRFETAHEKPGWPCAFRFSPDGKQILCARLWERGSNYTKELLLLDIESGKLRRIYRNEAIDTIWIQDWSSDGQTILATFERRDGTRIRRKNFALISINDGTARELKTPDNTNLGNHRSCVFSPDMRAIAYDAWPLGGGTGDIRLVAIDGSGEVPVVQHPADDLLVGWTASPDQIVFLSDRRGGWDAYTLQIRNGKTVGEPVLLAELGKGAWAKRLTRSGDLFFGKETRNVDVHFAKIDPASGRLLEKPTKAARLEGRSQWPAWSPDGRFLAYIITDNQDGVIGIRDVENGAVRELDAVAPRVSFPHWSNDGKSIYALSYASGQGLVYRINVDTSESTVVTKGGPYWVNVWPLWSWAPDGKSFYHYAGENNLFKRCDIETGERTEFEIPGSGNCYFSVFSPDCRYLVRSVTQKNPAGEFTRTISAMPISGGELRRLVELVGPEATDDVGRRSDQALCWTPDGRYVFFVKGKPTDPKMRSLWRVPIIGGEAEDLDLEMEQLRHPTISSDGRHIAFTAGGTKNELWVMENFLPAQKAAAR